MRPTVEELRKALDATTRDTLNQATRMAEYANSWHLDALYERARTLEWLASALPEMVADSARLDFLEEGGRTAYRSSNEERGAWVVDVRDYWDNGTRREPERADAPTLREAIDAATSSTTPTPAKASLEISDISSDPVEKENG